MVLLVVTAERICIAVLVESFFVDSSLAVHTYFKRLAVRSALSRLRDACCCSKALETFRCVLRRVLYGYYNRVYAENDKKCGAYRLLLWARKTCDQPHDGPASSPSTGTAERFHMAVPHITYGGLAI